MMTDLRSAFRQIFKSPGFAGVAIATLAIAIGLNTSIFTVVHALLLDPFPYPNANRLVQLRQQKPRVEPEPRTNYTGKEFGAFHEQARSFSGLAAMEMVSRNVTVGNQQPERVGGAKVTADFFTLLGVPPKLGRTLLPEEQGTGGPRVVVIGQQIWQNRFNSDPNVVGRTLELDAEPFTIVGVMPARFQYNATAFWFPFPFEMHNAPQRWYTVIGRLAPGATIASANAELKTIAARITQSRPEATDYAGWRVIALPLRDALLGNV